LKNLLSILTRERPVGTANNNAINDFLEDQLLDMGYLVESLFFDCYVWQDGMSFIETGYCGFLSGLVRIQLVLQERES
jgi:hypothetical protein